MEMHNDNNQDQRLSRKSRSGSSTASQASHVERQTKLAAIIQESRSLRGLPFCDDAQMQVHLSAWGRVLADVPTGALDDAFARASRTANDATNFTPTDVLRAHESLKREAFFDERAHSIDASAAEKCGLCSNEGWQRFELTCPQMRMLRVAVRPCACEASPAVLRTASPLFEPDWSRDERGVWLPQTIEAARRFPCECYNCKRSNFEAKARH
jgi:hypothetical protein